MLARWAVVGLAVLAFGCAGDDPEAATTTTGPPRATEPAASTSSTVATEASTTSTTSPTATSPPTSAVTSTTAPAVELAGRSFVTTAATGFELVPGTQLVLTFEVDQLTATFGCNTISGGPWSIEEDVLTVVELMTTEIGCDPPALNDQELWVLSLLGSDPSVTFDGDGDTLTLTEGQSSITLIRQP